MRFSTGLEHLESRINNEFAALKRLGARGAKIMGDSPLNSGTTKKEEHPRSGRNVSTSLPDIETLRTRLHGLSTDIDQLKIKNLTYRKPSLTNTPDEPNGDPIDSLTEALESKNFLVANELLDSAIKEEPDALGIIAPGLLREACYFKAPENFLIELLDFAISNNSKALADGGSLPGEDSTTSVLLDSDDNLFYQALELRAPEKFLNRLLEFALRQEKFAEIKLDFVKKAIERQAAANVTLRLIDLFEKNISRERIEDLLAVATSAKAPAEVISRLLKIKTERTEKTERIKHRLREIGNQLLANRSLGKTEGSDEAGKDAMTFRGCSVRPTTPPPRQPQGRDPLSVSQDELSPEQIAELTKDLEPLD